MTPGSEGVPFLTFYHALRVPDTFMTMNSIEYTLYAVDQSSFCTTNNFVTWCLWTVWGCFWVQRLPMQRLTAHTFLSFFCLWI